MFRDSSKVQIKFMKNFDWAIDWSKVWVYDQLKLCQNPSSRLRNPFWPRKTITSELIQEILKNFPRISPTWCLTEKFRKISEKKYFGKLVKACGILPRPGDYGNSMAHQYVANISNESFRDDDYFQKQAQSEQRA